jgi:hypothetical protein
MKRFLVQVDRTKSAKLNDSVNAKVLGISAESTETTRCSDEIFETWFCQPPQHLVKDLFQGCIELKPI